MHATLLQSCLTFCNCIDCSPPGSSVHRILQGRILEWVVMASFQRSSHSRSQTHISYLSCIGRWVFFCFFVFFFNPAQTKMGNNGSFTNGIKTSLAVQWLRLHAPNAGGLSLILGRGARSHMPQLRPGAARKKRRTHSGESHVRCRERPRGGRDRGWSAASTCRARLTAPAAGVGRGQGWCLQNEPALCTPGLQTPRLWTFKGTHFCSSKPHGALLWQPQGTHTDLSI